MAKKMLIRAHELGRQSHGSLVRHFIEARGAPVIFPPYSHDFNPIASVWALDKKAIKTFAPRTVGALRSRCPCRAAYRYIGPLWTVFRPHQVRQLRRLMGLV